VTYLNVSPAPQTWAIQETRRYVRYCRGQMLVFPALSRAVAGVSIRAAGAEDPLDDLAPFERALVRDHAAYGCICLVATDASGSRPIVFQRRGIGLLPRVKSVGQLPCFHLIYCRGLDDVRHFSAAIGRFLLRHYRMPWFVVDSDAAIPGLAGRFFDGRAPKYFLGPDPVRLADLAYTELVLFGP